MAGRGGLPRPPTAHQSIAGPRTSAPPILIGKASVVEQGRERLEKQTLKYSLPDGKNSWDQEDASEF